MFRSHRKGHRRVQLVAVAALALLAGGCATTQESSARRQACPTGETMVCIERMGRRESCYCESEDTMEEILRREKR